MKVETNIPFPMNVLAPKYSTPSLRGGRPVEYPWPVMNPGDSVFLDPGKKAFRGSLSYWKHHHPDQRFVTRKEGQGYRVWRVT